MHKIHFKGDKHFLRAHQIIWMSKNGPIPEGLSIDHINRDKTDNRLTNLRLVTPKENSANKESQVAYRKYDHRKIMDVYRLRDDGRSYQQISDLTGISKSHVGNIINETRYFGHAITKAWGDGSWEDGTPRVITGQKDRVNRLKALGNSIVPQVVYEIMMAIKEVDNGQT